MEFELLTILSSREAFDKFKPYIQDHSVSKYTLRIVDALQKYYDSRDVDDVDWSAFRSYFTVILHPKMTKKEADVYSRVFDRLQTETPSAVDINALRRALIEAECSAKIVDYILDNKGAVELSTVIELAEEGMDSVASDEDEETDDLDELVTSYYHADGFAWNLRDFDKSVGPLRAGDFVVIGARPETGKTSFALQLVDNIIQQDRSGRAGLVLNNEEDRRKIVLRNYSVVLGMPLVDIVRDTTKYQAEYRSAVGSRFIATDVTGMGPSQIESLVRKHKPRVVVFNVLDKVEGFYRAGNETERLRMLAKWARDLGKKYDCVVVAIAQADAAGEGVQYLEQSMLYGSKTGIPGEADLLIMIGKSSDVKMDGYRFVNICKNKLPGDAGTDPALNHNRFPLKFDHTTGRYGDA